MIRRTCASYLLGGLALASLTGVADSGEYVAGRVVTRIGDRCAQQLGDGFVDVGNGTCARVSRRIYVGPRNTLANPWTGGGTSSAALRSEGTGILPGASSAQRLRVRGNLDSYSPFR